MLKHSYVVLPGSPTAAEPLPLSQWEEKDFSTELCCAEPTAAAAQLSSAQLSAVLNRKNNSAQLNTGCKEKFFHFKTQPRLLVSHSKFFSFLLCSAGLCSNSTSTQV